MASRKCYSVKQVIEQLNNDAENDNDDSGDDVEETIHSDTDHFMLAAGAGEISDDLDERALQDGGVDQSDSESDDESWSCPEFVWKKAAHHCYIRSRETRVFSY